MSPNKPPSISVKKVEKLRNKLMSQVLQPITGEVVDVEELTSRILAKLPQGISNDTLFESLRYLAGQSLKMSEAAKLAWRLAGNLATLQAGQPVHPWTMQRNDEWVPFQVTRVVRSRDHRNRIGADMLLRALAGSPCPNVVSAFWTLPASRAIASNLGFSAPWGQFPFQHVADLVGLRFLGFIEQARSRSQPVFHEVACPSSLVQYNRNEVLRLRLRVNGTRCPAGYLHACRLCAVGYQECPAGTHRKTYEIGDCAKCGKTGVLFDPEDESDYCALCNTHWRLRPRTQ